MFHFHFVANYLWATFNARADAPTPTPTFFFPPSPLSLFELHYTTKVNYWRSVKRHKINNGNGFILFQLQQMVDGDGDNSCRQTVMLATAKSKCFDGC